ncbi:MAG: class I SAM-dependent methyltransferase [Thermoleophilaceae bacterium]
MRGVGKLKRGFVRAWYRSRALRDVVWFGRWPKLRRELPDLAHLALLDEGVNGPVQRDEALLLHGLLRVLRPRTVIEIGFGRGHSALNFLTALDDEARLYSFDIKQNCENWARAWFGDDPRFTFKRKSQTDLTPEDVDGRIADFVFLDASHDFDLNKGTFARLLPLMSQTAILAVHDTGTVPRELFPDWHWLIQSPQGWVGDEYEGQPGDREFVNWVLEQHPEFSQLHLHSRRTVRCGITLLQRSAPLARSSTTSELLSASA